MVHKTLVGGTAYEITGGKALVDGTVYSINNGKTLVGGTAYEVGFNCTVTIRTNRADTNERYLALVTINEQEYYAYNYDEDDVIFTVPSGTIAICNVASESTKYPAYVMVNDVKVAAGDVSYSYKITKDVTIDVGVDMVGGWMGTSQDEQGRIIITEQ